VPEARRRQARGLGAADIIADRLRRMRAEETTAARHCGFFCGERGSGIRRHGSRDARRRDGNPPSGNGNQ